MSHRGSARSSARTSRWSGTTWSARLRREPTEGDALDVGALYMWAPIVSWCTIPARESPTIIAVLHGA